MTRQSSNWDLNRFVKTLSYFGAVPILSQIDWFQQWFGSRPDPTVDSRSLTLSPTPMPVSPASTPPQTLLVIGTGEWLTALIDRIALRRSRSGQADPPKAAAWNDRLQPQNKSIRAISLDGANLPDREGVEWSTIDFQQPPTGELIADVRAIIGAIESESQVEPTVRFLLQAIARLDARLPLFDFSHPSSNLSDIWGAVDDVVMGGVSQSGIRISGDTADFSGQVSTANSGGFASVRTRNLEPPIDLSGYDGIELYLKGDGNRYKFLLRGETQWDSVAHSASFDTLPDQWITVRVPFATLIPVFRARTLKDAPLKLDSIRAFQLMLSKFEYDGGLNPHFQPGFFQLQVRSISAYKQPHPIPFVLVSPPNPEAEILLRQSGLPVTILRPVEGDTAEKIAEECLGAIDRV